MAKEHSYFPLPLHCSSSPRRGGVLTTKGRAEGRREERGNTEDRRSTLYILLAHTAGAVLIKHLRVGEGGG